MVISDLWIRSYKSFIRPVTIPLSPNVNVFIGPNNCGKTNILDAIDFLMHPDLSPGRLHHYRTEVLLTLELGAHGQQLVSGSHRVFFKGTQYQVRARDDRDVSLSPEVMAALGARCKMLRYEDFSEFFQIEKDYTLFGEKYPEQFKVLTALLRDHFPEVESITSIVADSSEGFGSVSVGSKSITIDRLGGGFRRVLVILLYALHPEYSIVMIDEPEIHLHPGMIKKLLKILTNQVTNQILITTHSPLFVTAYTLPQVYRVLKDSAGSHVYSLAQNPSQFDRARLVQELNADNLEMFFADTVLLVEGVSDRILMRGLIDRFYQGPADVKVIHVHGKSNIDVYIELMKVFHIPYTVMLDHDALGALAAQGGFRRHGDSPELAAYLQRQHITVLNNGPIEYHYPRHYQIKESKPLNALYAAAHVTENEYYSSQMRELRELIERL